MICVTYDTLKMEGGVCMDAKKLGKFIAEQRKNNHLTQAALAEKLHVTDKAVSKWERGLGFPDINTIEPLAEALGVSVLEIMKAEKAKESEYIASLKAADSTLPSIDPSRPKASAPIGATPDERAEHEWNTNADVRKEFGGDKAAFFAFYLAQENGQIKVLNKGE